MTFTLSLIMLIRVMRIILLVCFLLTLIFWGYLNETSRQVANAYQVGINFPLISEMTNSEHNPSNAILNNELHYAQVFRRAHYRLESRRVIRSQDIDYAIDSVSQEGTGIMPYLLKLAHSDRTSNGWPYWALLCGSISRISSSEGLQILEEIAGDEDAADYVRYWAQKSLSEAIDMSEK